MSELLTKIRAEQRARWEAGDRVLVEKYLDAYSALIADDELSLDLIYSEVLLREEWGEAVRADEYLRRFPRFAVQLTRQFELHALVRGRQAGEDPLPALPDFEIVREIGRGAWGVVYEARQVSVGRRVAIKMQHSIGRPDQGAILIREARLAAKLNHPCIAQLYNYGEYEGRGFLVMELVEGGSLAAAIEAQGTFPPPKAAALLGIVARAVHFAHEHGIIHRDLKPANVLLTEEGVPKVTDFGLAKDTQAVSSLSAGGDVIGTWRYMAPEQAAGRSQDVSPVTDVYALGLILHELLTGVAPLRGGFEQATEPEPATVWPAGIDAVLGRCLATRPSDRYPTALALAEALDPFATGGVVHPHTRGGSARRFRYWQAAPALAVLAAVAAGIASFSGGAKDADRGIRSIEAELAAGRSVVLVPARGGPGWSRWRTQGDPNQAPRADGDEFSIQSWGLGLLELVRDPMCDSYRLTAHVRHDESDATGEAGLYFGHREYGPEGGVHRFVQLSFNDIRPGSPVSFTSHFYAAGGRQGDWNCRVRGHSRQFGPAPGPGRTAWRKLVVEVTAREVCAFWEDAQPVGRYRIEALTTAATAALEQTRGEAPSHPHATAARPDFCPRGGLGLYILRGSAAYSQVVIEPLSR